MTIFTSNSSIRPRRKTSASRCSRKSDLSKKGDDTLVDRIGYRLSSRIYEMCKVVEMGGKDYRKIAKQASYRF